MNPAKISTRTVSLFVGDVIFFFFFFFDTQTKPFWKCWQGSRIFKKSYLPRASEDRKFTCPAKKFTFPIKIGKKLILNILFHVYPTWRLFLSFLPAAGHNASSCRDKEGLIFVMQFKRVHNAWRGWTCMVVKAESWLHFLRLAESKLAFHSTKAQVETSNPPPFLIKVIKNDFYALEVIKVYLYEPNID